MARRQFVGVLTDAGKVREQAEDALKPGVVGIGLIRAESGDAVIVDFVKLRARAERRKLPMPRGGGSRLRLGQNLRHCGANDIAQSGCESASR